MSEDDLETAAVSAPTVRKVRVRDIVDDTQLGKDMTFSSTDLSGAMMEQAPLFARYGLLAAQASRQVDDLKLMLEVTEAKVYRKLRDEAAATGAKTTEAQLEKAVLVHPQVIEVKKALNEARQIEAKAKTAAEAMRHRRDMLVQTGLISREEMKGELAISRRTESEAAMEAQKERMLTRLRAVGE